MLSIKINSNVVSINFRGVSDIIPNLTHLEIIPSTDIQSNRFVGYAGIYPNEEKKALGIAENFINENESGFIRISGITSIEIMDNISAGDRITATIDGKGKRGSGTMQINGRALESGISGDLIKILIN
jgi:hypothetical protein